MISLILHMSGFTEPFSIRLWGGASMTDRKKLPIGIDIFEKLDRSEFYYIDKTGMIEELLQNRSEVNLFTRPRRFGKSLNMSMLKTFFEIGSNPALFDGLKISENKEICTKYMGQFPVISISLKSVEGLSFQAACGALKTVIGTEALRFSFLEESSALSDADKKLYRQLIEIGTSENGLFVMTTEALVSSLKILSSLLGRHYGRQVILLIDEYDGDDLASMEDNNTSCFNYRPVEGTSSLSKQALGLAIDINPFYNPYITYNKDGSEKVSPANACAYADRTSSFPYKIDENDLCYQLFKEHGFTWGGHWNSCKDYQHFQKVVE